MNFKQIIENIKAQFRAGGVTINLIYANLGVFLITSLILVISALMKMPELAKQVDFNLGASTDINLLIRKPWTIITYMFTHGGLGHIFMNMLLLFFFGKQIENYLGGKKVFSLYVIRALLGLGLQIAAKNLFPLFQDMDHSIVVDTSGGVFAVMVALATYAPRLEVNLFGVFPVKLMWLVGGYFLLELLSVDQSNNVAHFTHIGGGIYGFVMIKLYQKGTDISKWFDSFISFVTGVFKPGKKKPRMKVKHSKYRNQSNPPPPPRDDIDFNAQKVARQKKLDVILDKIKVRGYDGLTKSEKEFLNNFK